MNTRKLELDLMFERNKRKRSAIRRRIRSIGPSWFAPSSAYSRAMNRTFRQIAVALFLFAPVLTFAAAGINNLDFNLWSVNANAANRTFNVTPQAITPPFNTFAAMDRKQYTTDNTGNFWVTNYAPGTYQIDILGPPDTTRLQFYVDSTNLIQYAGAQTIASPQNVFPPQRFAWSADASDQRFIQIANSYGATFGQALLWNGLDWTPGSVSGGGGTNGNVVIPSATIGITTNPATAYQPFVQGTLTNNTTGNANTANTAASASTANTANFATTATTATNWALLGQSNRYNGSFSGDLTGSTNYTTNAWNQAGVVPPGTNHPSQFWSTDANGNPGWNTFTPSSPLFSGIGSGVNLSAAMVVGSGASLTYSGSGDMHAKEADAVNANQVVGGATGGQLLQNTIATNAATDGLIPIASGPTFRFGNTLPKLTVTNLATEGTITNETSNLNLWVAGFPFVFTSSGFIGMQNMISTNGANFGGPVSIYAGTLSAPTIYGTNGIVCVSGPFTGNGVGLSNVVDVYTNYLNANTTLSAGFAAQCLTSNMLVLADSTYSNITVTFPSPPAVLTWFRIMNYGTNQVTLTNASGIGFRVPYQYGYQFSNSIVIPSYYGHEQTWVSMATNWLLWERSRSLQELQDVTEAGVGGTNGVFGPGLTSPFYLSTGSSVGGGLFNGTNNSGWTNYLASAGGAKDWAIGVGSTNVALITNTLNGFGWTFLSGISFTNKSLLGPGVVHADANGAQTVSTVVGLDFGTVAAHTLFGNQNSGTAQPGFGPTWQALDDFGSTLGGVAIRTASAWTNSVSAPTIPVTAATAIFSNQVQTMNAFVTNLLQVYATIVVSNITTAGNFFFGDNNNTNGFGNRPGFDFNATNNLGYVRSTGGNLAASGYSAAQTLQATGTVYAANVTASNIIAAQNFIGTNLMAAQTLQATGAIYSATLQATTGVYSTTAIISNAAIVGATLLVTNAYMNATSAPPTATGGNVTLNATNGTVIFYTNATFSLAVPTMGPVGLLCTSEFWVSNSAAANINVVPATGIKVIKPMGLNSVSTCVITNGTWGWGVFKTMNGIMTNFYWYGAAQ